MTEERVQRRLAAILAADVAGFSRLMGEDEEGTLARLRSLRDDLLAPESARFGGRIFKTTGDGALVEFPSAVDAVRCAMALQGAQAEHDPEQPEDRRLRLRIGIHLGDVMVDQDDLFGDGVNVAARLEALAEPGGICISGTAHDTLTGAMRSAFGGGAEGALKNIAKPVRLWHWTLAPMSGSTAGGIAGRKPVVAVLPFARSGGDAELDDFADGLADDLTSALARRRGIDVVSSAMSRRFKDRLGEIDEVRRQLSAVYAVIGSIRKRGDRLRVSAEILDTQSGRPVWSDHYDSTDPDLFELQDELTTRIAMAARSTINALEGQRAAGKSDTLLDNGERRARAAQSFYLFTPESFDAAEGYLEAVLKSDANDAMALAMMAFCIAFRGYFRANALADDEARRALALVDRAVQLDKTGDYAYMIRGLLALHLSRDHDAALADVRRSIELVPESSISEALLGEVLICTGDIDGGVPHVRRSIEVNPRDPLNFFRHWILGMAHFATGDLPAALAAVDQALLGCHEMPLLNLTRAAILVELGRSEDARTEIEQLRARHPDATLASVHQPLFKDDSLCNRYLEALRAAGLAE